MKKSILIAVLLVCCFLFPWKKVLFPWRYHYDRVLGFKSHQVISDSLHFFIEKPDPLITEFMFEKIDSREVVNGKSPERISCYATLYFSNFSGGIDGGRYVSCSYDRDDEIAQNAKFWRNWYETEYLPKLNLEK